jgi:hypothetical protein
MISGESSPHAVAVGRAEDVNEQSDQRPRRMIREAGIQDHLEAEKQRDQALHEMWEAQGGVSPQPCTTGLMRLRINTLVSLAAQYGNISPRAI